ncbi:MAG: hypothetical protein ABIG69_09170 [Bacteroidota bacterium]
MKNSIRMSILLILLFAIPNYTFAQEDSTIVTRVTLNDGSELIGQISIEDEEKIVFKTSSGIVMEIKKNLIAKIEQIRGEWHEGEFQRSDPNRTRLFFAPTAKTLDAGSGYFATYEIFFPFIAIGLNDFIILSGGMSLFPGVDEQMFYIAPKIRALHFDNFDLSAGVLYTRISDYSFGILYGVGTIGSQSFSFTGGRGWGYVDDELADLVNRRRISSIK